MALDLSRQKELDADPKTIQQIEFVGQLKNPDNEIVANESMFVLILLEKIKETRLKFSQESLAVLWIMANYQEVRVKLINTQLKKLKAAAKYKTGTILRIINKNFEDEHLPHELFLTTRQTTKIIKVFANNMSTQIKLTKAQISRIIQWGGSFGSWLGNLGKKAPTNIAIPLARENLPGLESNLASNAIDNFERKISRKGAVRGGKEFILFIFSEDMGDIIKIIKSLEDSGVLIDRVTETVKHKIKNSRVDFLELC